MRTPPATGAISAVLNLLVAAELIAVGVLALLDAVDRVLGDGGRGVDETTIGIGIETHDASKIFVGRMRCCLFGWRDQRYAKNLRSDADLKVHGFRLAGIFC